MTTTIYDTQRRTVVTRRKVKDRDANDVTRLPGFVFEIIGDGDKVLVDAMMPRKLAELLRKIGMDIHRS